MPGATVSPVVPPSSAMSDICLQAGDVDQIVNFNPESMGGESSGDGSEKADAPSQSEGSSSSSNCPPPAQTPPQLVITQQLKPVLSIPGNCGFRPATAGTQGRKGEAGNLKTEAPPQPQPVVNAGRAVGKKLTRLEENWLKEIRLMLAELRSTTDPSERVLAIEALEDSLVKVAKAYCIEGS